MTLANYDDWRMTPPHDAGRRSRAAPDTVSKYLQVEADDLFIDGIGVYDAETGTLLAVEINKREIDVDQVRAALLILCPEGSGTWDRDLDGHDLADLVNEAVADAEADRADARRDAREGF